MPRQRQEFQIFLASPGDVAAERGVVKRVVDELNHTLGRNRGFLLTVVGWDTDARPSYGTDAQGVINESIGQMLEHDLFVGILWNRFGTETPRAGSGTEEEFNRAAEAHRTHNRPEIMLYAGQMPANLSSANDLDQKRKVLDFLSRVSTNGLYWKYDSTEKFETDFRRHLEEWILSRLQEQPPEPPRAPTLAPPQSQPTSSSPPQSRPETVVIATKDWVLLAGNFFPSDSVVTKGDDTVVLELVPQDSQEDAVLREVQRSTNKGYQRTPVSFAHGNDAGIARVQSAESKSSGGKTVWMITLKVEQSNPSPLGEATINGITPDKASELRARLLLLDEPIKIEAGRQMAGHMDVHLLMSPMKEKQGIFPDLWAQFGKDPQLFLPLARLWAIYILRSSNICEHVLELKLTLVENNQALSVEFQGRRARVYSNREPAMISVSGRCALLRK